MATYRFECPVVIEGSMLSGPNVPHILRGIPWIASISLVKRNGVFVEQRHPTQDELIPLTEGVDYFIGGYEYSGVPQEVADVLTTSGFGEGLTQE